MMNNDAFKRKWNPPGSVWVARGEVIVELGLGIWLFIGFQNHPSKLFKLFAVLAIALNRSLAKIFNATNFTVRNGAFVRKTGPFFSWRGKRIKLPVSEIAGFEIVGEKDDEVKVEVLTGNHQRIEIDWNLTRQQATELVHFLHLRVKGT